MNEKLIEYFKLSSLNNKIGHAFLIGNICLKDIEIALNEVLSDSFFDGTNIDIYSHPDIFVLHTDKVMYTKSDIVSIQEHIQSTSQLSNYKIYIIDAAEKMNSAAANSLLKTLEEPENNVVAFLISQNVNLVLPTIKSRCQVIQISSETKEEEIECDKQKLLDIAKILEINGVESIAYINEIFHKTITSDEFTLIIKSLYKLYKASLYYRINETYSDSIYSINDVKFLLEKNGIKNLSKKLVCIHGIIELLSKNLNVGLLIDRFMIEFGRCNDE